MFKKLYTLIGCLGAFSSALYPGWAFSTCEFKEQSDLSYQLEIESIEDYQEHTTDYAKGCLLYTSPSPRDVEETRMPSSA